MATVTLDHANALPIEPLGPPRPPARDEQAAFDQHLQRASSPPVRPSEPQPAAENAVAFRAEKRVKKDTDTEAAGRSAASEEATGQPVIEADDEHEAGDKTDSADADLATTVIAAVTEKLPVVKLDRIAENVATGEETKRLVKQTSAATQKLEVPPPVPQPLDAHIADAAPLELDLALPAADADEQAAPLLASTSPNPGVEVNAAQPPAVRAAVIAPTLMQVADDDSNPDDSGLASAEPEQPSAIRPKPVESKTKSTKSQASSAQEKKASSSDDSRTAESSSNKPAPTDTAAVSASAADEQANADEAGAEPRAHHEAKPNVEGPKPVSAEKSAPQATEPRVESAPEIQTGTSPRRAVQHATESTATGTVPGGDVDRSRFVQRVSKAFQSASERGGPLRLRLSPPELGALRLEISVRAGVVTAKLEAETPAARSMLLDTLPALRERLAEHNLQIERFDIDLLNDSTGSDAGAPRGGEQAYERAAQQGRATRRTDSQASVESTTTGKRAAGPEQLDILI